MALTEEPAGLLVREDLGKWPGDRSHGVGSVVDGILTIAAGGISLLLILTGWDRVPGLRGLRPRAPISWLALSLFLLALAHNLAPTSGSSSVADTVSRPQTSSDLVAASEVLHGWDARREAAWASVDPATLRSLYVRGSAAGAADDQSLLLEHQQRLPQRWPADAEDPGELFLAEPFARLQVPGEDHPPHFVGRQLGQARLRGQQARARSARR